MKRLALIVLASTAGAGCEDAMRPLDSVEPPQLSLVVTDVTVRALEGLFRLFQIPSDVNDAGQIVARFRVDGDVHVGIWNASDGALVADLGRGWPVAINNLGQVVGELDDRGVIWDGSSITEVPLFPWDINDLGQVVGSDVTATGDVHALLWDGTLLQDLGTLGGGRSYANGINNLGQVVGSSLTAPGAWHAFFWDGTMHDLGPSSADAINDLGEVVGTDWLNGTGFLWDGTTRVDLEGIGRPADINNLGQIVAGGRPNAIFWDRGTITRLPRLVEPDGGGSANALNNFGQVVGSSGRARSNLTHVVWTLTFRPATPQEETAILGDLLQPLIDNGALNLGQGNALLSKFDAIDRQLERGNIEAAAGLFQAFINQVQAFLNAGLLTLAQGQPLIDAAENAIDQLNV